MLSHLAKSIGTSTEAKHPKTDPQHHPHLPISHTETINIILILPITNHIIERINEHTGILHANECGYRVG